MQNLEFSLLLALAAILVVDAGQCDTALVGPDVATSPILRELQKHWNAKKSCTALCNGFLAPAKVYWNDVTCIEAAATPSRDKKEDRLLPYLKQIIRDYISVVLVENDLGSKKGIAALLELVAHANFSGPQPYEFMLQEVQEYPHLLYRKDNLIFELGYDIHFKFGAESEIFNTLPPAVQAIVSGKPVRLRNLATKNWLAFKEFEEEGDSEELYVNAEAKSEADTEWTFEFFVGGSPGARWYRDDAPFNSIFVTHLQSDATCTRVNCTPLLQENPSKAREVAMIGEGYALEAVTMYDQQTAFELRLQSDDTVIIKRLNNIEWNVDLALTETVADGLRFLPQGFYEYGLGKMAEFFGLKADLEVVERTEEEKDSDLDRNKWIVSMIE